MSLTLSTTLRNALLDVIESTIGTSAVLKILDSSNTVLATCNLPSDWMAAASSGSKAKSGTWEDTSADASGIAAKFRIFASDGTTQHIEGTVTASGGGGDMEVDNTSFAIGQLFTVTSFSLTAPGA